MHEKLIENVFKSTKIEQFSKKLYCQLQTWNKLIYSVDEKRETCVVGDIFMPEV